MKVRGMSGGSLRAAKVNATQAAIRAGYSAKTAALIGHENLRKPNIAEAIETAQGRRAERAELTADMVVDELRNVAFANMIDYLGAAISDDPKSEFFALSRALTAAVVEMVVVDVVTGQGEAEQRTRRIKFKLHDKLGALDKLAKHLGLYDPKTRPAMTVEIDVDGIRSAILGRLARIAEARRSAGGDQQPDAPPDGGAPALVGVLEQGRAETAAG